ncbi:hypothetical protein T439DRAFT_351127 [Meredithblackwellia eburnea MCA 4105]
MSSGGSSVGSAPPSPKLTNTTSDDFSSNELSLALTELSWGVQSSQVLPGAFCPPGEARAKLELLEEGDSAVVGVSQKGWNVCLRSVSDWTRLPSDSADEDNKTFTTLDDLLEHLSPEFAKRRKDTLMDKLKGLSLQRESEEEERSQDEKQEDDEKTKEDR